MIHIDFVYKISLNFRYADYKCNDYHLDCLVEENQYFIVAPKDIVVATLYGHDDRVEWLIEHRYIIQIIIT